MHEPASLRVLGARKDDAVGTEFDAVDTLRSCWRWGRRFTEKVHRRVKLPKEK